jgi:hypothetical protein
MKTIEKRFRIIAICILADPQFKHMHEKLEIVADSIDSGFPGALKMVKLLEDEVILITE